MRRERILNSSQFLRSFPAVLRTLQPGERIGITRKGKTIGYFTAASKVRPPDFLANLVNLGGSKKVGQKLIDQICGSC
jgi:hypothetical protein